MTAPPVTPPSDTLNTRSLRVTEGPVVYVPHEELSLIDVAVLLVRQWKWLAVGIAIGFCLGLWWIAKTPKRYESRGVVRIGRSRASFPIKPTKEQQDMLLEPVAVASMRVREEYAAHSILGQQFHGAAVTSTVFDREADELLTILARASDPEVAQKFLNAVMQDFVRGHQQLFAPERAVMEDRLKVIETEQERLRQEIQKIEVASTKPDKMPTSSVADPQVTTLEQLTRAQFQQQLLSLEQEAVRLKRDIIDLQSQPTILLSPASLAVYPAEPRTTFLMGLGCVLGIILGCGMALAAEFVSQVRRRLLGIAESNPPQLTS